MTPTSFVKGPRKYRVLLGLVGALAGAGGWFYVKSEWRSSAEMLQGAVQSETAESPEQSSDEAGVIRFPRDMWETVGLRTELVKRSGMTQFIELTGKIALNEDKLAHIFPLVEGRVEAVNVSFGQRVRQGDLLVVVQSKEVGQGMLQLYQDRLKLDFARHQLSWTEEVGRNTQSLIEMMQARATVEEIEDALKDRTMGESREKLMTAYVACRRAEARVERLASLADQGIVPAREMLEAQSTLDAARAALQALLEQTSQDIQQSSRLATQSVKELETSAAVSMTSLKILGFTDDDLANITPSIQGERIAHYPVTAPFDGAIISKDVVLLERVGPERQILTIADLSTVWVTADVYETHLPLLAGLNDQTIYLRSASWPEKRFQARIFYTGDIVQESTRTVALRAIAENSEGVLKPGMFVTVELPGLATGDVLQAPQNAIQNHAGQTFVFVQTGDEEFIRKDVSVGRRSEGAVEILAGLEVNDRVVVEGGFALKSKMLADLLAE